MHLGVIWLYIYMYVCIYVYMYICMYGYIYIYALYISIEIYLPYYTTSHPERLVVSCCDMGQWTPWECRQKKAPRQTRSGVGQGVGHPNLSHFGVGNQHWGLETHRKGSGLQISPLNETFLQILRQIKTSRNYLRIFLFQDLPRSSKIFQDL